MADLYSVFGSNNAHLACIIRALRKQFGLEHTFTAPGKADELPKGARLVVVISDDADVQRAQAFVRKCAPTYVVDMREEGVTVHPFPSSGVPVSKGLTAFKEQLTRAA